MKKLLSLFVAGALAFGLMSCADGSVSLAAADLHDMTVDKISLGSNIKFRGTPNGWGTTDLTSSGNGVWYVEFAADASDIAFKFSDADWSKANTYNDSFMVAGTLPTGAALTNTDDGNGGTNAKITGLSKDSKYKMVITANNSGKLKIDVLSANYNLVKLDGFAIAGDAPEFGKVGDDWNRTKLLDFSKVEEDAEHSLTYTFDFKASSANIRFTITDATSSEWINKFAGSEIEVVSKALPESVELGASKEVTMLQRRINKVPYAYNSSTGDYVELYKKDVTYRVPVYYTVDGTDNGAVSDAKNGKIAATAEFEAKYNAKFNNTGKIIVAVDPTALEDDSFKEAWAKLTAEEKKAYAQDDSAIAALSTTKGKPGKITAYANNSYYPVAEAGEDTDNASFKGLIPGQNYKLTLKVTTKGVMTVKVEEKPIKSSIVISATGLTAEKEYTITGDIEKKAKADKDGNIRFPAETFETRLNATFKKTISISGDGITSTAKYNLTATPDADNIFYATKITDAKTTPVVPDLSVAGKSDLSMKITMILPEKYSASSYTCFSNIPWGGAKGTWSSVNEDANFGTDGITMNVVDHKMIFYVSADYEIDGWAKAGALPGTNFVMNLKAAGSNNEAPAIQGNTWFKLTSDPEQELKWEDGKQ